MTGLQLKAFRLSLRMTQAEFAKESGIEFKTLQNYEQGVSPRGGKLPKWVDTICACMRKRK
jgi:transcriptional regulator with XRE-family HTH domain